MSELVSVETNLPATPTDLLNTFANEIRDNVKVSGQSIQVMKNGYFKLPSGEETQQLDAVVVMYRYRNSFYNKPYKLGDYTPPICWAVGPQDNEHLTPHESSIDLQALTCVPGECKKNEFKSSPTGDGKACSNQIWIALMSPDPELNADIHVLKVSATAVKAMAAYLLRMTEQHKHPICVVTRFTIDTSRGYTRVVAQKCEPNPLYEQHLLYAKEAIAVLEAPPSIPVSDKPEQAALQSSGRAARN